jgi:hypothetical protein
MKRNIIPLLIIILVIQACSDLNIDFGGRQKCTDGQVYTGEFSLDQAGMENYDLDRITVGDYVNLQAGKTFDYACNGDSVKVTFFSDVKNETSKPVFVGCYIKYDNEITPLEVEWSGKGNLDQYSGAGKALAPKGYDEGYFQVVVEYGFLSEDNRFREIEFLRSVFNSLKIEAEYYRMN